MLELSLACKYLPFLLLVKDVDTGAWRVMRCSSMLFITFLSNADIFIWIPSPKTMKQTRKYVNCKLQVNTSSVILQPSNNFYTISPKVKYTIKCQVNFCRSFQIILIR